MLQSLDSYANKARRLSDIVLKNLFAIKRCPAGRLTECLPREADALPGATDPQVGHREKLQGSNEESKIFTNTSSDYSIFMDNLIRYFVF